MDLVALKQSELRSNDECESVLTENSTSQMKTSMKPVHYGLSNVIIRDQKFAKLS